MSSGTTAEIPLIYGRTFKNKIEFWSEQNVTYKFVLADVKRTILGPDFLLYYNLQPHLKDAKILLSIPRIYTSDDSEDVHIIQNNGYHKLFHLL